MRRGTLITIIFLIIALFAAAAWQLSLATGPDRQYPGPGPGTPLPSGISIPGP